MKKTFVYIGMSAAAIICMIAICITVSCLGNHVVELLTGEKIVRIN